MDIQGIGGLLGLPFKDLYDAFKKLMEKRDVEKQLSNVFQSLRLYHSSVDALKESGKALEGTFDNLKPPVSINAYARVDHSLAGKHEGPYQDCR